MFDKKWTWKFVIFGCLPVMLGVMLRDKFHLSETFGMESWKLLAVFMAVTIIGIIAMRRIKHSELDS